MRRLFFIIIAILGIAGLLYGIKLADPELIHQFAANI
jgi:phosphotransferase system  glucose/maltose/N-acetylglucosamine-specific IIC component